MRVDWTLVARSRVTEIASFIAEGDPQAAVRWVRGLRQCTRRLGRFPYSGPVDSGLGVPETRQIIYGAYLVYYRVDDAVRIMTVRHARRLRSPDDLG